MSHGQSLHDSMLSQHSCKFAKLTQSSFMWTKCDYISKLDNKVVFMEIKNVGLVAFENPECPTFLILIIKVTVLMGGLPFIF